MNRQCPKCKSTRVIGVYSEGHYFLTCLECDNKETNTNREKAMKAWEIGP
jgi:hypothetical protein